MTKSHGPRYAIKGKTHAWVVRRADGTFKKWTNKKRSLAIDKIHRAPLAKVSGYGGGKDYSRSAYAMKAIYEKRRVKK